MGHNGGVRWLRAAALLISISVAACGGGGEGPLPPAQEVVAQAAAATAALRSFHFRLTHENGTTPAPLGLQLESAEGDAVPPDRLKAEVRAKAMGSVAVTVEVIGIGGRTWITNPFTRRWQELPGATVRDIADPALIVKAVLAGLSEAEVAGRATVGGAKTYEVTGRLSSEALRGALPAVQAGRTVAVRVWVGVEDYLPRRAEIKGKLTATDDEDVARRVELSRFDAAVRIEPPE